MRQEFSPPLITSQTITPTTTQLATPMQQDSTAPTAAPMTNRGMKRQLKQLKHQEDATTASANAAKDHADARKQQPVADGSGSALGI